MSNIADVFFRVAAKDPERLAIIHRDRSITYGELARQVRSTAAHFRGKGLVPGDRVLVFVPMGIHPSHADGSAPPEQDRPRSAEAFARPLRVQNRSGLSTANANNDRNASRGISMAPSARVCVLMYCESKSTKPCARKWPAR